MPEQVGPPGPGPGGRPAGVAVDGLVVELGGRRVLDGIDLEAPAGRTTVVLGPSGGGKTTLLRVMAGLQAPGAGRVLLDGAEVAHEPPHRRDVGLMFQDHVLFPHRDVAANVAFGLRMRKVPAGERRARVAEVLRLVGLEGFDRRSVVDLSGGEAQRVALARALAPRPRVLLLDEPLGSLDRVLHDRLLADLRRLVADLGLTVVHVTHDREEALALGDHLVVLGGGRVLQAGPPRQVWAQPASADVARFLGLDAIWPVEVVGAAARVGGTVVVDGLTPAQGRRGDGPALLVVRPDGVSVVGPEADGALVARVDDVAFAGDRTSVVLDVAMGGGGSALPPLRAQVAGPPPTAGAQVHVRLDPHGCALLPRASG